MRKSASPGGTTEDLNCPQLFRGLPEYSSRHPQRRDEHVCRIGEKGRLIAFDQMAEPGQRKGCGDKKETDNPMEPNNNNRRKAHWNGDQVQRTIHRMVVCAIVMRVE